MRTKLWGLALLAGVLLGGSQARGQTPFQWESNLQTAAAQAASTNRLVLVHFWAHWCQACLRMEQEVFSQPDVQAAIQADYVPVRLNVDHNRALAQQFGISSLPTDVVITPNGRVLQRQPGFIDRYQYVARLRQVAVDARRPPAMGPSGPPALAAGVPAASIPAPPAWTPPSPTPPPQSAPPAPSSLAGTQPTQVAGPSWTGPAAAGVPSQVPLAGGQLTGPSPEAGHMAQNGVIAQAPAQGSFQPPPNWQPPQPDRTAPPVETSPSQPPSSEYWMPLNTSAGPTSSPTGVVAGQAAPPAAPPTELAAANPPVVPNSPGQGPATGETSQPAAANPPLAADVSQPPVPPGPASACPFALEGYCPVELVENKNWKLGDIRWGANHRGRTYLFSGVEQQQKFLRDPDRYSPVASGVDVVLATGQPQQIVAGRREYGVFCADRVFLFSSEQTLAAFSAEPERYLRQVQALDEAASQTVRR